MDAAILDQTFQSHLGHLTTQGAVGGQDDGLRRVVDDEVHTGRGFQRTDVAPFTTDDASFHVLAGQGNRRDGLLVDVVAGITLDDVAQDLLGLAVGSLLGFRLDLADHLGRFVAGLGLHLGKQTGLGFFRRQAGNLGKTLLFFIDARLQELFRLGPAGVPCGPDPFQRRGAHAPWRWLFPVFLPAGRPSLQACVHAV